MKAKGKKMTARRKPGEVSAARLAQMIEEATVDAYGEGEQAIGWFTMLEEHLELPFEREVLGVRVMVARIEQREDGRIVAMCVRGKERQPVAIADLRLPRPRPGGAEWIAAYRHWLGGR
jgi:hypothetical protein